MFNSLSSVMMPHLASHASTHVFICLIPEICYCQHSAAVYERFQANIKVPETPQKSYLIDPSCIWLLSSGTNQVTWQTRVKRHKICHGNRSGTKSRACLPATARMVGSWKCVMKNLRQLGSSKHIWSETDFKKKDSKVPWFGLLPSTELQDASSLLDRPAVRVLKVHRHHHLTGLRKAPVP